MPVEYQKQIREKKPKEPKFKEFKFAEKKPFKTKVYEETTPKIQLDIKPKIYTPDEALLKMEQFCAYQERSPREVNQKLKELGMTGVFADKIYLILEGDNYINEHRFAHAYAGGKFRINYWGKVKIGLELRSKGIPQDLVNEALSTITEEEYKVMFDKVFNLKKKELEQKNAINLSAKLANYLLNLGYEKEIVYGAVLN
jgi:regulatory protein